MYLFSSLFVLISAQIAVISAAAIDDVCTVGYCTLNGGTSGGKGGATVTVSSLAALETAVAGTDKRVVVVSGTISGAARVYVGSNKTIVGNNGKLVGIGLTVMDQTNVIIRNLVHQKVLSAYEDAITLLRAKNVWVDHMDMSSDLNNGKDYYDGLVDVTHACDWITISNSYFHDHYKGSLVGHSDNNQAEDSGHLTVTYANNHWYNIYSRAPMFRIGTGHIINSYWDNCEDGIRTRAGAQLLIESSQFENMNDCILTKDGYANVNDVDLGEDGTNEAPAGTLKTLPYSYTLLGSQNVKAAVVGKSGATLTF